MFCFYTLRKEKSQPIQGEERLDWQIKMNSYFVRYIWLCHHLSARVIDTLGQGGNVWFNDKAFIEIDGINGLVKGLFKHLNI